MRNNGEKGRWVGSAPTFLEVVVPLVHVETPLLALPLQREVVAELAFVALGALALLEERTEHGLGVHTCGEQHNEEDVHFDAPV